ncbi:MAG: DUF3095 family protein [Micavibrio sp.]|nr:DUF3095 family protein [Micavibrio sp.]
MTTSTRSFYKDLPPQPAAALVALATHNDVPDDWHIIIADIAGSTKAIEAGRYKDVNMVSASAITAVLNAVGRAEIAYIFGGDGATLLVPSEALVPVAQALYGTKIMSQDAFGLDMRVGAVSASELKKRGARLRVAKTEISPGIYQAALSGEGVTLAEQLVKDKAAGAAFAVESLFSRETLQEKEADFRGLECRWQPLHSRNGADVSIIVLARSANDAATAGLYGDVLGEVGRICGHSDDWKPAHTSNLNISASPVVTALETRLRTYGQGMSEKVKYFANVWLLTLVGIYCVAFGKKAGQFDGKKYQAATAQNTDYIKFDNALRLVMDVSKQQQHDLTAYLEGLRAAGKIFYGMHSAPAALMTCLVFDYGHDHFHFVDGADGGYALAAKQMKAQMKAALEKAA